MRLRRHADTTTPATGTTGAAWDGVSSRPAAPPVIRAPRAAELVPPSAPAKAA